MWLSSMYRCSWTHRIKWLAEYEVHCSAPSTKRQYHQLFFGRLVAEGGKIKLLREALNIISAAQTILPNGLVDVEAQMSASL